MNYKIFASIVFIAFFHISFLSAEDLGHSAPLALHAPDSSSIAGLKSTNEFIEKDSFQKVEDTILPPCDIIFFKSGKIDYCKIIETTPTNISYKMCDYVDGPTIIVNKSTVKKIRYANGREEIVTTNETLDTTPLFTQPRRDAVAIWSLIASLSSIVFILGAVAGIVLGIISLNRIRKSNGRLTGRGTARAGIIIGLVIIALVILTL